MCSRAVVNQPFAADRTQFVIMILSQSQVLLIVVYFNTMFDSTVPSYNSQYSLPQKTKRNVRVGLYRLRTLSILTHRRVRSVRTRGEIETTNGGAYCRNGGTLRPNSRCECPFPFTGRRCVDYSCVHGISVGARYDPDSLFFNRPCICDEGWIGELCEVPTADQVTVTIEVNSETATATASDIFLVHNANTSADVNMGNANTADAKNGSQSCVCPARFSGIHCDRCTQNAPKIRPYPDCTIHISTPKARILRQKTDSQIRSRVLITVGACSLLLLLIITMFILHQRRQMKMRKSPYEERRRRELKERQNMLERAAISMEHIIDEERLHGMPENKPAISSHSIITDTSLRNNK
ncbi:hypothetical protein Tcan_05588 [Toxocara canis]|uniref:EGF-like domain-containing protein n=1 Tax=Toxocara canis TaxID=6265 RepID=A0A0B2VRJ4_TOXCA|nr:hypothetical protein Tcan_05588 [Toxocara canis]